MLLDLYSLFVMIFCVFAVVLCHVNLTNDIADVVVKIQRPHYLCNLLSLPQFPLFEVETNFLGSLTTEFNLVFVKIPIIYVTIDFSIVIFSSGKSVSGVTIKNHIHGPH